jgi:hypothetical protein
METVGDFIGIFNNSHNNQPQSQPNDYNFSNVVLCVKKNDSIDTFVCHKFNTFIEADKYFNSNYSNKDVINSTMIPICKFMPIFLEKKIIQYKLSTIFNKIELY